MAEIPSEPVIFWICELVPPSANEMAPFLFFAVYDTARGSQGARSFQILNLCQK